MFARRSSETTSGPVRGTEESACIFCDRLRDPSPLRDRLIYEDDLFHVSHQVDDAGPTYLGLALLQTKRHVRDLSDLSEQEAQALGPLLRRLSRGVEEATGAEWTYCYSFLEGSRHLHILVTARYRGVPREFVRLAISDWPDAPKGDRESVRRLCQAISAAMSRA
jgi:diadenosine tetraphosphate (Ap4A) HIT family hydrolase